MFNTQVAHVVILTDKDGIRRKFHANSEAKAENLAFDYEEDGATDIHIYEVMKED